MSLTGESTEKRDSLSPFQIVLLFGLISLIADAVYEGARGIIPNYLEILGASALIVGTVLGVAEFIGYLFRIVSGTLTDRWQNPWPFVLSGYAVLIVIPLLAMAGHWAIALVLLIVERMGKSVRGPARDTILSSTTRTQHAGKVFGLHELMDQTGAILGPLLAVVVLFYTKNNYQLAFLGFSLPYAVLLVVLILTYVLLKKRVDRSLKSGSRNEDALKSSENSKINDNNPEIRLPRSFYYYGAALFFNIAGLVHFSILLLMINDAAREIAWMAAAAYLLIMGVDAIMAPLWGVLFDRIKLNSLIFPFFLAIVPSLLLIAPSLPTLGVAAIFFGIVLAAQESIYRAGISHLVPIKRRGTAYGYLYFMMGLGSLVSGAVFGFLLDQNLLPVMIVVSIIFQAFALFALILLRKEVGQ